MCVTKKKKHIFFSQSRYKRGNFIKKESLAQVFSCEVCEISKNTFFYRTPSVAASELSYKKLLDKANSSTMNVKRPRSLCVEIYKTINNLNLSFMKQIFELRETNRNVREKYRLNLNIPNYNQVTFGKKSLRILGPKIWNSLPYHIKSSKNLETFKTVIKNWDGVNCKCVICKKL